MANLVLWGHHLDEYQEMFDLNNKDLQGRLLEYGSGPSAFNVEVASRATECVSCDALFNLDESTLKTKATLVFADRAAQIAAQEASYDFSEYGNLQGLMKKREEGMALFFSDYQKGVSESRYVGIKEIELPFYDFKFDLALSSHYFFAGLDNQDIDFHIKAIQELARVAYEVRIFPLIDNHGELSAYLGPVLLGLQQMSYGTEIRSVPYHLEPKGNAMLRVWAHQCQAKAA